METTIGKKMYEAMFLIDSAVASSDWDKIIATLVTVLKKADSEIVSIRKWDERKLAYEINGKSRGTYILCYFRADGRKVHEIEKAVQLSEQIMRVLILSAEKMSKPVLCMVTLKFAHSAPGRDREMAPVTRLLTPKATMPQPTKSSWIKPLFA